MKHPYASPLQAQDLSNLPLAMLITGEYVPSDEGEQYAGRLREAGNQVMVMRYNGMIHGFFGFRLWWTRANRPAKTSWPACAPRLCVNRAERGQSRVAVMC